MFSLVLPTCTLGKIQVTTFNRMQHCSFPFYTSFLGIISAVFLDSEVSSCSSSSQLFNRSSTEPPAAVIAPDKSVYSKSASIQRKEQTEGTPFPAHLVALHRQNKRLLQTDEYSWSSIWLDYQWLAVLKTSSSVCLAIVQSYCTVLLLLLLTNYFVHLKDCIMEVLWKSMALACILLLHIFQ